MQIDLNVVSVSIFLDSILYMRNMLDPASKYERGTFPKSFAET